MKLIIHDLNKEQAEKLGIYSLNEEEYMVVDSTGSKNTYCIGCFGCWLKTPGRCIIKDNFQTMGERLAASDEILIISKATFGSYSSAVKNVLDRSIAYVLPYFSIRNGEMHHGERYHKNLKVSAAFYGDMTEVEKKTSLNLVMANAVNLNGAIEEVDFFESADAIGEVF